MYSYPLPPHPPARPSPPFDLLGRALGHSWVYVTYLQQGYLLSEYLQVVATGGLGQKAHVGDLFFRLTREKHTRQAVPNGGGTAVHGGGGREGRRSTAEKIAVIGYILLTETDDCNNSLYQIPVYNRELFI